MAGPGKPGQPNAFTPERAAKVIEAIRKGNTREAAANHANVAPSVVFEWIQKARAGHPDFAEFAEKLRDAEWHAESEMVDVVTNAAKDGNYQAALEWLGRRKHAKWGRKDTLRVQKLPDPKDLTPAQLESAVKAALEQRARLVN